MNVKKIIKWALSIVLLSLMIASQFQIISYAATVKPYTGLEISDSRDSITLSGTDVTITATGSLFSKKTNTITFENASETTKKLSFTYTVSNADSHSFVSNSGTISEIMTAGETFSRTITSKAGYGTVTLTLTNVTFEDVASTYSVTVNFDSSLGSVKYNGSAYATGASKDIDPTKASLLVAKANSGAEFVGWFYTNDVLVDKNAAFSSAISSNITLNAVFADTSENAMFLVNETYLYDSLDDAIACADENEYDRITVASSGILPAGNYTISSGVTLLIPYDIAHTLHSNSPGTTTSYSQPTAYRTLTMQEGAHITVNGAMSLSAKIYSAGGGKEHAGSPTGKVSFVKMQTDSSITIEDGGALYTWGYITGSGKVIAKSGAEVYECFQFMDYLGGSQSSSMKNNVFPISQYFVQNIEVPMTVYSGANEYCATSVNVSVVGILTPVVNFIGASDSLFSLSSGYLCKDYDEVGDRLIVDIYGDLTISPISLTLAAGQSINSYDYILPINGNLTITIHRGIVTANQHIALIPGAELKILQSATLELGTVTIPGWWNETIETTELYVYDVEEWDGYCGTSSVTHHIVYAPGRTGSRAELSDATILVNGTLDASEGYFYTTSSGSNVYSTDNGSVIINPGSRTKTYQFKYTTSKYVEIPIAPAFLKNADGSMVEYVKTGTHGADTYVCVNGYWHLDSCRDSCGGEFAISTTATCTDAGQRTTTCDCYGYNDINCDCHHKEEDIAALGHKEGVWSDTPVDGYELCFCPACQVELARRLYSTLDLDYRLNDYIWMNATVTILASGKAELVDDYGGTIQLVKGNDGTYYLVRKVLSTDLTSTFKVTLSIGEIKTVELDLSFTTFANGLGQDHPHKALVNAMINYGKAADDYFPDADTAVHFDKTFTFAEICVATGDRNPSDGMKGLLPARNEYNGVKLKTAGATIDFANCLGMVLRFKTTDKLVLEEGDSIAQIGFMIGTNAKYMATDGTAVELTDESYDDAFIYFGETNGTVNGSDNNIQGINGAVSGVVGNAPADLSQEMRLRFDMTKDQYLTRFAMRPFIVILRKDGTYLNLYGEQVLYGFEDYCARIDAKTTSSQKSKNLVVYAWKYALEAARAKFEGE